jgi:hypothetical protein
MYGVVGKADYLSSGIKIGDTAFKVTSLNIAAGTHNMRSITDAKPGLSL